MIQIRSPDEHKKAFNILSLYHHVPNQDVKKEK